MKNVFLDFTDEDSVVDSEYINLIKNDKPFYQDVYFFFGIGYNGQEYKLKTNDSPYSNDSPEIIFKLKYENKPIVFMEWKKIRIDQLYIEGTNWTQNEKQSIARLEEIGILSKGNFKEIIIKPIQMKTWDIHEDLKKDPSIFYAIMIDADRIIGRCMAEFISPDKLDNYEIPEYLQQDKEMIYIYISSVDIHPNYLGKRRCKPLVTFMIKSIISKLGLKSKSKLIFFIENASQTQGGIPACLCYIRAGWDSNLEVFYPNNAGSRLDPMNEELCKIGGKTMPITYYYISNKSSSASSATASMAPSAASATAPLAASATAKLSKKKMANGINPVRRRSYKKI
jgi:hypothetical protein